MRRKILFYLLIILMTFLGCQKFESPLSQVIAEKVSKGDGTIINLSDLTNFNWDKLYIYGPYESRVSIQNNIGQQFLKSNELPLGVSEGNTLFVFVKDNKVVYYFNHPRSNGDFSELKKYNWFTPSNAKFQVIHGEQGLYGKWLKLVVVE